MPQNLKLSKHKATNDDYVTKSRDEMLEDLYAACLKFRRSNFYEVCIDLGVVMGVDTWGNIDRIVSCTRDIEEHDLYGRDVWKKRE